MVAMIVILQCSDTIFACVSLILGIPKNRRQYQEREQITELGASIEHNNIKDIVLNTAQMRNHIHLLHFRVEPVEIDREDAIITGAAREIAVQRTQTRNSNNQQSSNSLLQTVVNPLRARGRAPGRPRGRGRGQGRGRGLGAEVGDMSSLAAYSSIEN